MTRYLLDRDVMSQLDQPEAARHENVRAWFRSVPDDALHVSVLTINEAWRGFGNIRKRAVGRPAKLSQCDAFESAFTKLTNSFAGRIIAVDDQVAKLWEELRGALDKN